MKGLILSGGLGTRMRPFTYSVPKQLVPIANKPVLFYVIDALIDSEINDIGIIVSPSNYEKIRDKVQEVYGDQFEFIIQEQPLGLAHCVTCAEGFLNGSPFVMHLGDNMLRNGVKPLLEDGTEQTRILLKEVMDPTMFGVAEVSDGYLVRLEEKPFEPKSNLALVGVYLFQPSIYNAIKNIAPSRRGEYEITDALNHLIQDTDINVEYKIYQDWWIDTGKKDDLLTCNKIILHEMDLNVSKGKNVTVIDSYFDSVSIGDSSTIINSQLENCVVMESCNIQNVSISNSIIGSNSIINGSKERTLIFDDTSLGAHSKLVVI